MNDTEMKCVMNILPLRSIKRNYLPKAFRGPCSVWKIFIRHIRLLKDSEQYTVEHNLMDTLNKMLCFSEG